MIFSRTGALAGLLFSSVIDTVYPESCLLCGALPHLVSWCATGPRVPGLRPFDRPHLCARCLKRLAAAGPVVWDPGPGEEPGPVHVAACPTTGELTTLVGAWKYHGVRGMAWPLAALLTGALASACRRGMVPGVLVPVPLHGRRRRSRGFNQAAVLARLAGRTLGLRVDETVARRVRATGQQARLQGAPERLANMAGVFAAEPPAAGAPRRLTLVDDVVTSGATTGELARVLGQAGWEVGLVAALGLAHREGAGPDDDPAAGVPVDTPGTAT